ncbi:MAG: hypothetical protein H6561_00695 [Lewinellaceae bacterium]|nr:hypothetical protein [Lewinellaceae bacterium]HPQ99006.1 heme peroxidase family protein [Saprospiraceae bacterium]
MLNHSNHFQGVLQSGEILFETDFGYIFNYLSCHKSHRLPAQNSTIRGLMALGEAMADPGELNNEQPGFNSQIPAIYTYLGQFIDHDITARTDRETSISEIGGYDGNPCSLSPLNPNEVIEGLTNGRRPQLDLDSVFGDGPAFASEFDNEHYNYETKADALYNKVSLDLKLNTAANHFDLNRTADGRALIADARNDENLMISQLHASFIAAYNKIMHYLRQHPDGSEREARYSKARRLLRWSYQYVVIHDYLNHVCDPAIVYDTMENGPFYFLTDKKIFMPLEFSVAAFRFGHSMIRPFYLINQTIGNKKIMDLLGETFHNNFFTNQMLDPANIIDWNNFVGATAQHARKIDWRLAKGLFDLSAIDSAIPAKTMLAHLAQRNLIRGYKLSLPTGQAVAQAMGINPLTEEQLLDGISQPHKNIIKSTGLGCTSPLWFYVLKEASIHNLGERLGAVGSRLVAETLIGLIKTDKNSFLNNQHAPEVKNNGIEIVPGTLISNIQDLLKFAGRIN